MVGAKMLGAGVVLGLVVLVGLGNLLHRVVFPAAPPDPATFPRVGDTFGSVAEGFTQHVVAVRDGWLGLRTQIAPYAPGPPMHFHTGFAETFTVESGTLHIELPGGAIRLGPGESYRIEPGTPHRPHNPSAEAVVVASDAAMPQAFGACLVQIYHFLDAAGGAMSPGLALRIAALGSHCDSTMSGVPAAARAGIDWVVLPFARAFGFANYYPERSLHPRG